MKNHPVGVTAFFHRVKLFPVAALVAVALTSCVTAQPEAGFVSLFDGKTLNGWTPKAGSGYGVTNGVIYCGKGRGGNLMTDKEFDDFILRFEFKLEDGSNNGIGIRAPLDGDAAYLGMEIQILEDGAADRGKWGKLRAEQYHGSIYGVVAAKRGALKPPGEWNTEEITAQGRHIKVVVNGKTIVDANLNDVTDPEIIRAHPGLVPRAGSYRFPWPRRLPRVPQPPHQGTATHGKGQFRAGRVHRVVQREEPRWLEGVVERAQR